MNGGVCLAERCVAGAFEPGRAKNQVQGAWEECRLEGGRWGVGVSSCSGQAVELAARRSTATLQGPIRRGASADDECWHWRWHSLALWHWQLLAPGADRCDGRQRTYTALQTGAAARSITVRRGRAGPPEAGARAG